MINSAKILLIIFLCFFINFVFIESSYSATEIILNIDPAVPLTLADFGLDDMEVQIQDTSDLNGPFVANAFALANLLGYPVGKAYIGSFPHFELGISAGAGCTNMEYYDENEPASDNGSLPGIMPALSAHFGLGLFGGFDVLGKVFYVSKSMINKYKKDVDYETDVATLNDFLIYSMGGKLRYNVIKKKRFLPFYLAFGGITLSLGGNFMYGKISFLGDYEYSFDEIEVNLGAPTPVDMEFDGQFGAQIDWSIFTIDAQAIAYFDIFYLFSIYTGFGVAGNIGSFDVEFSGTGQLATSNSAYQLAAGTDQIGSLIFLSENKYRPAPVLPTYVLGLEINIIVLKLNVETMVNLLNRSDVNIQAGTRIQI
ncbi:MAG: hypothetical protein JW864_18645 [Spirochaetes bacterium]|nr:hypothetical protein [Spirochaetota bacterium]